MTISVEIADRLYDYTDEEKASDAVASFQADTQLDDAAVLAIWLAPQDPRRDDLERRIFDAVDANGSAKRAAESIPGGIELVVVDADN